MSKDGVGNLCFKMFEKWSKKTYIFFPKFEFSRQIKSWYLRNEEYQELQLYRNKTKEMPWIKP